MAWHEFQHNIFVLQIDVKGILNITSKLRRKKPLKLRE